MARRARKVIETPDQIPAFASEEEEARFWADHELGDGMLGRFRELDGVLPSSRPGLAAEAPEQRYARLTQELRDRISQHAGAVMIFLGAGLSFGVARRLGRASFETPPPLSDDARFPSWPMLIDRMRERALAETTDEAEHRALTQFFAEHDALDAAQLFRLEVGDAEYWSFLEDQFQTRPEDADRLTPSHEALVRLPVPTLFTTNYDRLIELAFARWNPRLAVSSRPPEFLAQQAQVPERHLVKLHGSIERPESIVLTRDDYARSRRERAEMFGHLAQQARFATFIFVGFSLADPTFNLIRDEARMVMGEHLPPSYLVQQRTDRVTRRYLRALGVEVVELFSWNALPQFLQDINPTGTVPTSVAS